MQNVPENPEKSSCGSYMSAGMFQKVTLDILRIILFVSVLLHNTFA